MESYDTPMLTLLAATAAAAAARQAAASTAPQVQSHGSPDLFWCVEEQAMGHGLRLT